MKYKFQKKDKHLKNIAYSFELYKCIYGLIVNHNMYIAK